MNFFAVIAFFCIIAAACATLLDADQQPQRQAIPAAYRYEDFLEEAPVKRAQTFVRFGKRAQTFVRFGRSMPARYAQEDDQ